MARAEGLGGGGARGARARLFVALELPDEVRGALSAWCSTVVGDSTAAGEISGLREVKAEALHVTLCFLGSRPVEEIEAVGLACQPVAAHAAMALALGSALWLPPRRPRVLAVTLEDPDHGLAAIAAELSARLHAGGWYTPERRPFLPHVTVARVRRDMRGRPPALPPPLPGSRRFTGAVVTLFRSRLGAGGARYEALRTVVLRR